MQQDITNKYLEYDCPGGCVLAEFCCADAKQRLAGCIACARLSDDREIAKTSQVKTRRAEIWKGSLLCPQPPRVFASLGAWDTLETVWPSGLIRSPGFKCLFNH